MAWWLVVLIVGLLLVMAAAGGPVEAFQAPSNEKRKNMLAYLGLASARSAPGDWDQTEQDSFAALTTILNASRETSSALYRAQILLRKQGSYSGQTDGVWNAQYETAARAFTSKMDGAVKSILQKLQ